MPLFPNGRDLIRRNLEVIERGERVPRVSIGRLTAEQIEAINRQQSEDGLPASIAELVFVGRHIFKRRIQEDGYSIDDVIDQIENGLSEESIVEATPYMTKLKNPHARPDRYGNLVKDEIILECSRYRPTPDVFSVIPKGDQKGISKRKGAE